jgi:TolB protein
MSTTPDAAGILAGSLAPRAGTGARVRTAVVVLAAVPGLLAVVPAARADGDRPPALVFTSDRDGDSEIYLRSSDGQVRRLTDNDSNDYAAAWSPDGRHLAFVSDRDGDEDIYVMRADGSRVRQLTTTDTAPERRPLAESTPAWSPHGRRIAFSSDRTGGAPEIWVMRSDGRRPHRLTSTEEFVTDITPVWSPDGRSIAFVSDRAGNETADVYVMRRDGSDVRAVTPTDDVFDSTVPDWSPDGQLIAYTTNITRGQQDIWAVDPAGGEPRFLGGDPDYDDVAPRWTSDARQIVFWTFPYFEERSADVWVMAGDGSRRRVLVDSPAEDSLPDPRPGR